MGGSDIDMRRLSKAMSYALRHRPEEFGLSLDGRGAVGLGELVDALNARGRWPRPVTPDDVAWVVANGTKQRFALEDGRIRARYGHSFSRRVELEEAEPPVVLWHGTSHEAWEAIREEGLQPMGRQTVHLSADRETALAVGARHERGGEPVLLRIDAASARAAGVIFWRGNESTWLAGAVPAKYLERVG